MYDYPKMVVTYLPSGDIAVRLEAHGQVVHLDDLESPRFVNFLLTFCGEKETDEEGKVIVTLD